MIWTKVKVCMRYRGISDYLEDESGKTQRKQQLSLKNEKFTDNLETSADLREYTE